MVASSGVMLIDQIERIPFEVEVLIYGLALSESVERLIEHHVEINFKGLVEALLLHVFASISEKVELLAALLLESLHNLGAGEISLSRVGEDADAS